MTRTELLIQAKAVRSMKRVDLTGEACARSLRRDPVIRYDTQPAPLTADLVVRVEQVDFRWPKVDRFPIPFFYARSSSMPEVSQRQIDELMRKQAVGGGNCPARRPARMVPPRCLWIRRVV